MADRTADLILKTRPRIGYDSFPIADGVTLGVGAIVQLQSGFLNHWDDSGAASTLMGILIGGDDRARDGIIIGETSDTPDPRGRVDTSGVVIMHLASVDASPTQAKVGDLIYCSDSDVVNIAIASSGRTDPIGWCIEFRSSTDIDVQLFTPAEFLAQQTA